MRLVCSECGPDADVFIDRFGICCQKCKRCIILVKDGKAIVPQRKTKT